MVAAGIAVAVAGCSAPDEYADIWEAYGTPGSNELRLFVATCNAELSADVIELDDEVTIAVTARNNTTDDCLDILTIQLASPLGERSVMDAFDGDALVIQPRDT